MVGVAESVVEAPETVTVAEAPDGPAPDGEGVLDAPAAPGLADGAEPPVGVAEEGGASAVTGTTIRATTAMAKRRVRAGAIW